MPAYPSIGNVVLASASPRRREMLASLGLEFTVLVPAIEETAKLNEHPRAFAERLASEKAAAVSTDPGTTIIAADTIVVLDGHILGKPSNEAHAAEMLSNLSGKTHEVITGVCIRNKDVSRIFSVLSFCQTPAFSTYKNIFWVPPVLRNQIAREKIEFFSAFGAFMDLDPQKILHMGIG